MSADGIAHLKVTLDEVQPPVLRRIEVPLAIRLDRLHLALQAAMGRTNSHLYVSSKRSARRRSSTSTISATAGSTRSRSSASPRRCRASHTRA